MKKTYLTLATFLLALSIQAQIFDYSLSYIGTNETTGNYEVALMGTPDFDETTGNSSDMGAVVSISGGGYLLPTNTGFVNDCTFTPPSTNVCDYDIAATEWDATYLSDPSASSGDFVYQFLRTPGTTNVFLDAVDGAPIVLAVFQVAGNPTTGEAILVENGDPILSGTSNSSFFNINYPVATAGITSDIVGVIDTTPVNFSVLSTQNGELAAASLYPNPTNGNVFIKGVSGIENVEVMNVNGQRVMQFNTNLETFNVSDLDSGVYFVKLETAIARTTIKLIKK